MGSTEYNIGLNENSKSSSRVLKPPGGGHSNIFDEAEVKVNPPRPKYNQQNSSNLNAVMGTVDPNIKIKETGGGGAGGAPVGTNGGDNDSSSVAGGHHEHSTGGNNGAHADDKNAGGRVRVPPGGFSSGLW